MKANAVEIGELLKTVVAMATHVKRRLNRSCQSRKARSRTCAQSFPRWNEAMRNLPGSGAEYCRPVLCPPIVAPDRTTRGDGLFAAAVVRKTGQPLASSAHECALVEIPAMQQLCGRFHLASLAQFEIDKRSSSF